MAQRLQLSRARGWRKPPGAVIVDRRTVYGNPWTQADARMWGVPRDRWREWCVRQYVRDMAARGGVGELEFVTIAEIRERLTGLDLLCWCPLDQPWCHADVLLRVAAGGRPGIAP